MQNRFDSNSLIIDVMKVQVFSQIHGRMPLLFVLFLAVSLGPRVAGSPRSWSSNGPQDSKTPWGNQLPDMLVAYYRHHGVHSLMLVVCHTDIGKFIQCMQCAFLFPKLMTQKYSGKKKRRYMISDSIIPFDFSSLYSESEFLESMAALQSQWFLCPGPYGRLIEGPATCRCPRRFRGGTAATEFPCQQLHPLGHVLSAAHVTI